MTRIGLPATGLQLELQHIGCGSSKRQQPHRPRVTTIARYRRPDLPG